MFKAGDSRGSTFRVYLTNSFSVGEAGVVGMVLFNPLWPILVISVTETAR